MRSASIQALDAGLEHAIVCMEDCIDDLDIMYREHLELFLEHDRIVQKFNDSKENIRTIEGSLDLHGSRPLPEHEVRRMHSMGIHRETLLARIAREELGTEPEEGPETGLEPPVEDDDPVEPGEPNEDPEQDD